MLQEQFERVYKYILQAYDNKKKAKSLDLSAIKTVNSMNLWEWSLAHLKDSEIKTRV